MLCSCHRRPTSSRAAEEVLDTIVAISPSPGRSLSSSATITLPLRSRGDAVRPGHHHEPGPAGVPTTAGGSARSPPRPDRQEPNQELAWPWLRPRAFVEFAREAQARGLRALCVFADTGGPWRRWTPPRRQPPSAHDPPHRVGLLRSSTSLSSVGAAQEPALARRAPARAAGVAPSTWTSVVSSLLLDKSLAARRLTPRGQRHPAPGHCARCMPLIDGGAPISVRPDRRLPRARWMRTWRVLTARCCARRSPRARHRRHRGAKPSMRCARRGRVRADALPAAIASPTQTTQGLAEPACTPTSPAVFSATRVRSARGKSRPRALAEPLARLTALDLFGPRAPGATERTSGSLALARLTRARPGAAAPSRRRCSRPPAPATAPPCCPSRRHGQLASSPPAAAALRRSRPRHSSWRPRPCLTAALPAP